MQPHQFGSHLVSSGRMVLRPFPRYKNITLNRTLIRVLQNAAFLPDPFLIVDNNLQCEWNGSMITPGILTGGERGLLGLAFHPQYGTNKRFFINFTDGNGGHTVIAELRASAGDANMGAIYLLTVEFIFRNGFE
jgi:hypothetical protein